MGLMRRATAVFLVTMGCNSSDGNGLVSTPTGGASGAGMCVPVPGIIECPAPVTDSGAPPVTGGQGGTSGQVGGDATGGSATGGTIGSMAAGGSGGFHGTGGASGSGGSPGTGGAVGSMTGAGPCANNPEWACINGASKFPWRCLGAPCPTADEECRQRIDVTLVCRSPGNAPTGPTQIYAARAMPCRAHLDCGGPNSRILCNDNHICGALGGYPCVDGFQCFTGQCKNGTCTGTLSSGQPCREAESCASGVCTTQMFCQ
jgi:hypothetical protein